MKPIITTNKSNGLSLLVSLRRFSARFFSYGESGFNVILLLYIHHLFCFRYTIFDWKFDKSKSYPIKTKTKETIYIFNLQGPS
jgi:hypothetical protein